MAAVRLAALCDHALVAQDGKVSLVGIFRNLSVSAVPAQHPRMFLVCILGLDAGDHVVTVQLRRPNGSPAMPNPPQLSVKAVAGQDVNVIVELNNLNFADLGEHQFVVESDGQQVAGVPLSVSRIVTSQERRTN